MANPVNDMYADAVLAVILQVESNPTAAQGDYFTLMKPRLTLTLTVVKRVSLIFKQNIPFAAAFILYTFKIYDVCCML